MAGNHEASSHLWELYYGGWVAPNIYYMGAANVVRLGPLRIAGMSGIWKGHDYRRPHHERLPFGQDDVKTFYHVRELDVRKLLQLRTQVDIGISHDWPRAVERHGDQDHLFRMKPFFKQESLDGTLGNPAAQYVMDRLRPPYWFSAHMHVKFSAVRKYDSAPAAEPAAAEPASSSAGGPVESIAAAAAAPQTNNNPDEISLDLDDEAEDAAAQPPTEDAAGSSSSKAETPSGIEGVSAEVLAQLPASFARPQAQAHKERTVPGQPVPPTINQHRGTLPGARQVPPRPEVPAALRGPAV